MVQFAMHFYKAGSPPFQTLSDLPQHSAHAIMRSLYRKDSVFWERFADPAAYLSLRKQLESELRREFQRKGGRPQHDYPIYFMLGRPKWTEEVADAVTLATTQQIEVPLSSFAETDISFTYPDSMVSWLIAQERNPEYYEPEYHGKLFLLGEISEIIDRKGLPGEQWQTKMPRKYAHYIEVQVWNRNVLSEILKMSPPST